MKQYITIKQLNELTPIQKGKLLQWYSTKNNSVLTIIDKEDMLLSIGQMIELLSFEAMFYYKFGDNYRIMDDSPEDYKREWEGKTLCDALWKAVKEKLL